jgi:addiction module RelE/StbE family toxin
MKSVIFHHDFDKHYKKRIKPNEKLVKQFEQRYRLFLSGERGSPLDDHPLNRKLTGRRAFSVTGDIRVVYIETNDEIIFLDIGTHNQVY